VRSSAQPLLGAQPVKVLCQFRYSYLDPTAGHECEAHDAVVIEVPRSADLMRRFHEKISKLLEPDVVENRFPAFPFSIRLTGYRPETMGPDGGERW
jgi:hypothetical protein